MTLQPRSGQERRVSWLCYRKCEGSLPYSQFDPPVVLPVDRQPFQLSGSSHHRLFGRCQLEVQRLVCLVRGSSMPLWWWTSWGQQTQQACPDFPDPDIEARSAASTSCIQATCLTLDSSSETVTSRRPSGEYETAEARLWCDSRMYSRVAVLRSYTTTAPSCVPTASRWLLPWKAIDGYVFTSLLRMKVAVCCRTPRRFPLGSSERTTISARRGRLANSTMGF